MYGRTRILPISRVRIFAGLPGFKFGPVPEMSMQSVRENGKFIFPPAAVFPGLIFLGLMIVSAGCTVSHQVPSSGAEVTIPDTNQSWKEIPLTDLQGRGNFSIASLAGKPVIIPVVSDGCPSCTILLNRQLNEIDRLAGVHDGSITVVALDLDPPAGPGYITAYHDQFNFTGYSARSPPGMTSLLFDKYGLFVAEADAVPVILICPDGRDQILPPGVKVAGNLSALITRDC